MAIFSGPTLTASVLSRLRSIGRPRQWARLARYAAAYIPAALLFASMSTSGAAQAETAICRPDATGAALSDPAAAGLSTDRLRKLDVAMERMIKSGSYAGITTMVARHGHLVNFDVHGYRDLGTKSPLGRDAIFWLASMTKPITGTALMILYEDGKWQLDDPVAKFAPELAGMKVMTPSGDLVAQSHPMTMRELLTNTAGLPSTSPGLNPRVSELYAHADLYRGTLSDMIATIASLPLSYQPGTAFEYGISQDVQAYIVEKISGQRFDAFLKARLFTPLGMADTDFWVPAGKRARLATIYDYDALGGLKPVTLNADHLPFGIPSGKPHYLSGAGGLYSTAADYMRFAQMLLSGGCVGSVRILAPSTVRLMTSDLLPHGVAQYFSRPLQGVGYGVDVGVVLEPGHANYVGPVGAGSYYWSGRDGTWWINDPANDLILIGMVQQESAAAAHTGVAVRAPDLRALSRSIVYQALIDP